MHCIITLLLACLLFGCAKDHDQNDPYVIEQTEFEEEPPTLVEEYGEKN